MTIDKTKDIKVGGTLHSIATGNIIVHADEVMDDDLGKKQSDINQELRTDIEAIKVPTNISELTNDVGYITEHQSLENYVTSEQLEASIASIPEYDDTDLKNRIETLENFDHSVYAEKESIYTKEEVDASIADAVKIASDSIGDIDLTPYAKTEDVTKSIDKRIEDIVGAAPEALDTLEEIAAALNNDSNVIETINGVLSGKANESDVDSLTGRVENLEAIDHTQFLTEHQSLEGYVKSEQLDEIKNRLTNLESWYEG